MHFICTGVTYKLGVCTWHERKIKTNIVAKGTSQDDFPENGVGRWSYNYTSDEPMYCFGRVSNTFASEGSPIFLPKFGSVFSRTTSFVLKMMFSHTWVRQV